MITPVLEEQAGNNLICQSFRAFLEVLVVSRFCPKHVPPSQALVEWDPLSCTGGGSVCFRGNGKSSTTCYITSAGWGGFFSVLLISLLVLRVCM